MQEGVYKGRAQKFNCAHVPHPTYYSSFCPEFVRKRRIDTTFFYWISSGFCLKRIRIVSRMYLKYIWLSLKKCQNCVWPGLCSSKSSTPIILLYLNSAWMPLPNHPIFITPIGLYSGRIFIHFRHNTSAFQTETRHYSDTNTAWFQTLLPRRWATEVWACPVYRYSPRKYADVCGDWMRAAWRRLALFAIVKLRTLRTSVMDS